MRAKRRALGFSVAQFAALAEISSTYVDNIERGTRIPSVKASGQIARALDVNADYIEALAGRVPAAVDYLREQPEAVLALVRFFARARRTNFSNWDALLVPRAPRARRVAK